jgi:hypothetical protein
MTNGIGMLEGIYRRLYGTNTNTGNPGKRINKLVWSLIRTIGNLRRSIFILLRLGFRPMVFPGT